MSVLSKKQKAVLCQIAARAYAKMEKYDLLPDRQAGQSKADHLTAWRRAVLKEVTGKSSLTLCTNHEFRKIEAAFHKIAGEPYKNPGALVTGKQSAEPGDTIEAREQNAFLIVQALWQHEERCNTSGHHTKALTEQYVLSIARAQYQAVLVDFDCLILLSAKSLKQLLYTVNNRIAARERKLGMR